METALARIAPQALDAYEPRNFTEAQEMALAYSKSKILGAFGTPEAVLVIMATGAELGIPPTAALRSIYVVEGRPFLSADLMVALCRRRPDICQRFDLTESTSERATYTVQRKGGQPVAFSFTIADAKQAGLSFGDKSNWTKYPGVMLRHRAAATAARAEFSDLTLGLYCEEERDEMTAAAPSAPTVDPLPSKAEPIDAEIVTDRPAEWRARIAAAATVDELEAVRLEVKDAKPEKTIRDEMVALYTERKAAL